MIVEINRLEEEGDALFTSYPDLVHERSTADHCLAETLDYMEKCCDACEEVSEVIESVIMKNS